MNIHIYKALYLILKFVAKGDYQMQQIKDWKDKVKADTGHKL